jgi:hypothetical protein
VHPGGQHALRRAGADRRGRPPVKILTVAACAFPTRQGSQVLIRQAAEALAARGHEVIVACYAGGEDIPCGVPIARAPRLPGSDRLRAGPSPAKPLLDAPRSTVSPSGVRRRDPRAQRRGRCGGAAAARGVPVVYPRTDPRSGLVPLPARARWSSRGAWRSAAAGPGGRDDL